MIISPQAPEFANGLPRNQQCCFRRSIRSLDDDAGDGGDDCSAVDVGRCDDDRSSSVLGADHTEVTRLQPVRF